MFVGAALLLAAAAHGLGGPARSRGRQAPHQKPRSAMRMSRRRRPHPPDLVEDLMATDWDDANKTDWRRVGSDRRKAHARRYGNKRFDMELVFLGTASCTPSITRGVSCTALRYDGATWLFDAGEGTQIQVQRCSNVHPGSVSKIFVTHTHGDHSFGLPGLLCLIGSNRDKGSEPIDIYGPDGLRLLIRSMLRLTFSRVAAPYRVHELKDVPVQTARGLAPPRDSLARHERELRAASLGRADAAFGEVDGGRDIQPDADGCWTLFETSRQGERHGDVGVRAAPMAHTVPCVGYVVREHDRPGRLDIGLVEPVVQRNAAALKLIGVKQPKRVFRILKDLAPGQSMTFPDGTVVSAEDCLAPPRDGRVVAICGDTADASAMLPLLGERGADVVVHEATNTYIPKYDPQTTAAAVRQTTASHGHSTPEMAAAFAIKAGARRLVLTHFSARYKGDSNPMSMDTMLHIEDQARNVLRPGHAVAEDPDDPVVAAWDFLTIPVPPRGVSVFDAELGADFEPLEDDRP